MREGWLLLIESNDRVHERGRIPDAYWQLLSVSCSIGEDRIAESHLGVAHGSVYGNHVHHVNRLGIYVDAWDKHTHDIAVYNNLVHDCAADGIVLASEAGGLLQGVSVYNNVIYDNNDVGIVLAGCGEPSPSRPIRDILVINNTIYHNGIGTWGGGICVGNEDTETLTIRNNIVSRNYLFQILVEYSVVDLSVDFNLIDGYQGYPGEIHGTDYVTGDPLFIDIFAADFHLQTDSPAVDAGSPDSAPAFDLEGIMRPQGEGYDMGAFEVACISYTLGDR